MSEDLSASKREVTETNTGGITVYTEHHWKADFKYGTKNVQRVEITSRPDGHGQQIGGAKVYVGDTYCGALPATTDKATVSKTYYVDC
jgi:hypothetical protein